LAIANPLLAGAKEAAWNNAKEDGPKSSQGNGKENHALAKRVAAANGGWMSEKLTPRRQGEVFSLDIPFYRTRHVNQFVINHPPLEVWGV
jgi:hypothetical protein